CKCERVNQMLANKNPLAFNRILSFGAFGKRDVLRANTNRSIKYPNILLIHFLSPDFRIGRRLSSIELLNNIPQKGNEWLWVVLLGKGLISGENPFIESFYVEEVNRNISSHNLPLSFNTLPC